MGDERWEGRIDELLAAFDHWAASDRVEAAAAARARERWLRQQASEDATLAGSLIELCEAGSPVMLSTASARLQGHVVAVGADCCLLVAAGAGPCLVRLDRLSTVVPTPDDDRPTPRGARPATLSLSFFDILATLAADRSPVTVTLAGGNRVTGELLGVGADHLQLRSGDTSRRLTLVALASLELCILR